MPAFDFIWEVLQACERASASGSRSVCASCPSRCVLPVRLCGAAALPPCSVPLHRCAQNRPQCHTLQPIAPTRRLNSTTSTAIEHSGRRQPSAMSGPFRSGGPFRGVTGTGAAGAPAGSTAAGASAASASAAMPAPSSVPISHSTPSLFTLGQQQQARFSLHHHQQAQMQMQGRAGGGAGIAGAGSVPRSNDAAAYASMSRVGSGGGGGGVGSAGPGSDSPTASVETGEDDDRRSQSQSQSHSHLASAPLGLRASLSGTSLQAGGVGGGDPDLDSPAGMGMGLGLGYFEAEDTEGDGQQHLPQPQRRSHRQRRHNPSSSPTDSDTDLTRPAGGGVRSERSWSEAGSAADSDEDDAGSDIDDQDQRRGLDRSALDLDELASQGGGDRGGGGGGGDDSDSTASGATNASTGGDGSRGGKPSRSGGGSDDGGGGGGWYGQGRSLSNASSVASRFVHLDEEVSLGEQASEDELRRQRKEAAERKRLRDAADQRMPCPPMCGVSWGIHGQLVYFSNLPLLTHYLVTNQRRRAAPHGGATSSAAGPSSLTIDGSDPSSSSGLQVNLLTSPNQLLAAEEVDHEEEENSAWAGAAAMSAAAATAAPSSHPAASQLLIDIDEVLPRSYFDLLKLPYVAAHLGYVVGDDLPEPASLDDYAAAAEGDNEEAEGPPSPAQEELPVAAEEKQQGASSASVAPAVAPAASAPTEDKNAAAGAGATSTADASSSSQAPLLPAVLDLGSIDLESINLTTGGGSSVTTLSGGGSTSAAKVPLQQQQPQQQTLKPSGSMSSLPRGEGSNTQLDELALGYDLLDELDSDGLAGSAFGSGAAGGEDFFSSFFHSTLQLGVVSTSLPAYGVGSAGASATGPSAFVKPGGSNMVPPLPSAMPAASAAVAAPDAANAKSAPSGSTPQRQSSDDAARAAAAGAGAAAASSPAASAAAGAVAPSTATAASAIAGASPGAGSVGGVGGTPALHSWSALSSSLIRSGGLGSVLAPASIVSPGAGVGAGVVGPQSYARRRIRINTSLLIMDCSAVIPVSPGLAGAYVLAGASASEICRTNQSVAAEWGRADLAATWNLAALACSDLVLDRVATPSLTPWSEHPLGGRLAEELIRQYLRIGDVQTVAMLASVFSGAPQCGERGQQALATNQGLLAPLLPSRGAPTVVQWQEIEGAPIVNTYSITGSSGSGATGMHEALAKIRGAGEDQHAVTSAGAGAASVSPPSVNQRRTPSPAVPLPPSASASAGASSSTSVSAGILGGILVAPAHPMSLLASTPDASSRTWGPGSKAARILGAPFAVATVGVGTPSGTGPAGGPLARVLSSAAVSSSYSSGTASPSDSIYNTNANQRLKWKTGPSLPGQGASSSEETRGRAASSVSRQEMQAAEASRIARIAEDGGGPHNNHHAGLAMNSPPSASRSIGATPHGATGGLTPTAASVSADGSTSVTPSGSNTALVTLEGDDAESTSEDETQQQSEQQHPRHQSSPPAFKTGPPPLLHVRVDHVDLYRLLYAEYLYRLGLFAARARLLKGLLDPQVDSMHVLTGFDLAEGLCGINQVCASCGRECGPLSRQDREAEAETQMRLHHQAVAELGSAADGTLVPLAAIPLSPPRCRSCLHAASRCSVCELAVRGVLLCCFVCGHGGHSDHLASWFAAAEREGAAAAVCPTGCGCRCVEEGGLDLYTRAQRKAQREEEAAAAAAAASQRHRSKRHLSKHHSHHASRGSLGGEDADDADRPEGADDSAAAAAHLRALDGELDPSLAGYDRSGLLVESDHTEEQMTHFWNPANTML